MSNINCDIGGYHTVTYPDIRTPDIGSDIDTDLGTLCHRYRDTRYSILYWSEFGPDIGYAAFNIGDMISRYRETPDIETNIGVYVIRYRDTSGMSRYRGFLVTRFRDT